MGKRVIKLTESKLKNMIRECVKNIIDVNRLQLKSILEESRKRAIYEIDHREATKPLCNNMDASDELRRGNDMEILPDGTILSYYDKRRESSKLIYKQLTQGVIDNVGKDFHLQFERPEPDETSTEVHFFFTEVILLTDDRVVLEGNAIMNRSDIPIGKKRPKKIQIDYKFKTQQFFEAVFCANNTVRDMRQIFLDIAGYRGSENIKTAEQLIHFLCLCYYSKEDKKTDIANKPPMSGNIIQPFSH